MGASLVVISPEISAKSQEMALNNNLNIQILRDSNNTTAKEFGLVFTLPEELRPIYTSFGIDLATANGTNSYELPVPATYLIGPDQTILMDFVDVDHTKRLEPQEVVTLLKEMKQ